MALYFILSKYLYELVIQDSVCDVLDMCMGYSLPLASVDFGENLSPNMGI
jgi:hypothetical protein